MDVRWYYVPLSEFPSYKRMIAERERVKAAELMRNEITETRRARKWWRRLWSRA